VDLHTHSPASYDFKPDADRCARDWAKWVSAAINAGLDAVALTDHNTPDGISGISAAAASRGLTVFPGVEITVSGIHLLCLYDPASARDDVVALLAKLGVETSQFGQQDASSSKSILETVEIATATGAVVIAAHANGPKGLLTATSGLERLKVLQAPGLIAAELTPSRPGAGEWLDPAGEDIQSWLDGSKTDGRRLSQMCSSDSHAFSDAGKLFTWVKMARPDIEGLRLALLDGPGSLQTKESGATSNPNDHADNVIESIAVRNAKYMGRSNDSSRPNPLTLEFNPWLNAIIGGRGTGKSTLVDFCRLALRREDELGVEGEDSLRAVFGKRMRVPATRSEEGLLTAETVIEVVYRKDGERFVVSWDKEGKTRPVSRLIDSQRVAEDGDVRERFPVRIYSQKQLFDLAKDPNALLSVIDDSSEVGGADLLRVRKEAEAKYLSLCAEARLLRAQASELPARRATLADVQRKLEVLQKGGHANTLSEYRDRRKQDETWESIQKATADAVDSICEMAELRLAVADLGPGAETEGDTASAALVRAHGELRDAIAALKGGILGAVGKARSSIAAIRGGANALTWKAAVSASDRAYQSVTQALAEAGIANPSEYGGLLKRSSALEHEIGGLEQREQEATAKEREAAAALGSYRKAFARLSSRRLEFARNASGDLIKVHVRCGTRRENLEEFLREVLGIPRFEGDYRGLMLRIAPQPTQEWRFEELDSVVAELRRLLVDPQMPWSTTDRRFEAQLRRLQAERLDRLALYLPEDGVEVSIRDPRDGNRGWRELAQGSPGQQTAALLAFVLGYGCEPIILDQPEDDLDSTLIYELLVRRLREKKQTRQVIVVTHNPNIVVHGDAELVVSLDARGGQTCIAFAGGLQEQKARDEICRVMEGGRDAFRTRYQRIMLPNRPRD
jgi:ABC-type cobalamin/Fe3+-siderophores transport system ATPase subunit